MKTKAEANLTNTQIICKATYLWFLVSLAVIFLDQISKYFVSVRFQLYESIPIMPMLNITLAHNTGAAFSLLSQAGSWHTWFFTGFTIIISIILTIWIMRLEKHERLQLLALSFILGGALGNLIDRLRLGYVIDFIQVYYKHYYWPIFNVADSAITVGTILLAIAITFKSETSKPT